MCTTCHGASDESASGFLSRFDLVDAAVRVDLGTLFNKGECPREWALALDAGRLVVPFGAYSAQVNPGVYRTVSKPLIYNMGQRARDGDLGDSVLPMPYSDQGVNLSGSLTLLENGSIDPIT